MFNVISHLMPTSTLAVIFIFRTADRHLGFRQPFLHARSASHLEPHTAIIHLDMCKWILVEIKIRNLAGERTNRALCEINVINRSLSGISLTRHASALQMRFLVFTDHPRFL